MVFSGLTARYKADKLFVSWSTASEFNNDHFFVEASFDGENFTRIAIVQSKADNGTSVSALNYSISIDGTGTVVTLGAVLLIALLSLHGVKRRTKWVLAVTIITFGVFFACRKKDGSGVDNNTHNVKYIRIAQVDKDGITKTSKAIVVGLE